MAAIMAGSQLAFQPLRNVSSSWNSTTSSLTVRARGVNSRGELYRVLSTAWSPKFMHPAHQSFRSGSTGLSSISNSRSFTISPQALRHLSGRPHNEQDNPVVRVVKAIFDFFKNIWNFLLKGPGLLFAKQLESKIDKATDVVEDAAKAVISLTKAGRSIADTLESGLEEIEKYANLVVHATEVIDDKVEDAVDVLENAGESLKAYEVKTAAPVVATAALKEKAIEVKEKTAELAQATSELKAVSADILQQTSDPAPAVAAAPAPAPASATSQSTTKSS